MKRPSYWRERVALPQVPIRSALMIIVLYVLGVFATAIYVANDPKVTSGRMYRDAKRTA